MNPQFKRAGLASGSRAQNPASVLGHTILIVPPLIVFGCCTIGAYVLAPLVVPQAEAALEDAAWAIGRIWAGGVALTRFCEGAVRHDKIVADDPVAGVPPRPHAPIIVIPHPDIGAPPLTPRHDGAWEGHPKRKHRHASRGLDMSAPPLGRRPDTPVAVPAPHHGQDGAP